jgi:TfoX/Sxy family transcriptional regulator of competence genes
MAYDAATVERVRKVLAGRSAVVEKKLMGGLCFMVNGSLCCSVSGQGGLLVRIEPAAQASLLRFPHVTAMQMGKRTMRGFVRVAPQGYRTDRALAKWVLRGLAAISTRPQRATRPRHKQKTKMTKERG